MVNSIYFEISNLNGTVVVLFVFCNHCGITSFFTKFACIRHNHYMVYNSLNY